jgi:hypothetical protein
VGCRACAVQVDSEWQGVLGKADAQRQQMEVILDRLAAAEALPSEQLAQAKQLLPHFAPILRAGPGSPAAAVGGLLVLFASLSGSPLTCPSCREVLEALGVTSCVNGIGWAHRRCLACWEVRTTPPLIYSISFSKGDYYGCISFGWYKLGCEMHAKCTAGMHLLVMRFSESSSFPVLLLSACLPPTCGSSSKHLVVCHSPVCPKMMLLQCAFACRQALHGSRCWARLTTSMPAGRGTLSASCRNCRQ